MVRPTYEQNSHAVAAGPLGQGLGYIVGEVTLTQGVGSPGPGLLQQHPAAHDRRRGVKTLGLALGDGRAARLDQTSTTSRNPSRTRRLPSTKRLGRSSS